MTVAVRVIPCLDVDGGRVVKGVNFRDLRDAGDPVELAALYDAEGADELTFLDITASSGGRQTMYDVVRRTAEQVFIPLTVGGGVRSSARRGRAAAGGRRQGVAEHRRDRPARAARRGRPAVRRRSAWCCRWTPGGCAGAGRRRRRRAASRSPRTAAAPAPASTPWTGPAARVDLGAGEILLNSMDADGTEAGFDLELIRLVRAAVTVPVIASGGAGALAHFAARRRRGRGRGAGGQRLPLRHAAHRAGKGSLARRRAPGPVTIFRTTRTGYLLPIDSHRSPGQARYLTAQLGGCAARSAASGPGV